MAYVIPRKALQRLQSVSNSIAQPASPFQRLVLIIHSLFLEAGFVALEEQPSNVPGFAPTIREIHSRQFISRQWNTGEDGNVTLLYRHRIRQGKTFLNTIVAFDDGSVILTFSQRNGSDSVVQLNLNEFVTNQTSSNPADLSSIYQNLDFLWSRLSTPIGSLLPELFRQEETQDRTDLPRQIEPDIPFHPLNPSVAIPATGNPYNIGNADLQPSFYPQPIGPAGGSLVGPDHPMFSPYQPRQPFPAGPYNPDPNNIDPLFGQQPYPNPPFLPGYGIPQPRYDPIYPEEIYPDGMGGGRGAGRGGRGRGAPGRGRFSGEPNPDHFRPPGW